MVNWMNRLRVSVAQLFGVAGCCVAAAGVTGCFLQPASQDVDSLSNIGTFEERPVGDLIEQGIEEFVRPIGDPDEEFVDGFDDVDDPEVLEDEGFGVLNEDGQVAEEDIATFQEDFGAFAAQNEGSAADLDGDGVVTLVDFQMFLDLVAPQEAE